MAAPLQLDLHSSACAFQPCTVDYDPQRGLCRVRMERAGATRNPHRVFRGITSLPGRVAVHSASPRCPPTPSCLAERTHPPPLCLAKLAFKYFCVSSITPDRACGCSASRPTSDPLSPRGSRFSVSGVAVLSSLSHGHRLQDRTCQGKEPFGRVQDDQ